jgi:lysophospholipase L1-like esterase
MGTRVLAPLLLPVLYVQGRRVRRTLPRLPEPPGDRAGRRPAVEPHDAGRAAVQAATPPLRLLVVGDSAAAGVGARSQDEALAGRLVDALAADGPRRVAPCGSHRRHRVRHPPPPRRPPGEPFDVAVTSLGLNDVTAGRPPATALADLTALVDLLRSRFGVRHVVLSGLPPVGAFPSLPEPLRAYLGRRARALDAALAAWAATAPDVDHLRSTSPPTRPRWLPTASTRDRDLRAVGRRGGGAHPGAAGRGGPRRGRRSLGTCGRWCDADTATDRRTGRGRGSRTWWGANGRAGTAPERQGRQSASPPPGAPAAARGTRPRTRLARRAASA